MPVSHHPLLRACLLLCAGMALLSAVEVAPPPMLTAQGRLTESGSPINGSRSFSFAIIASDGTTVLWSTPSLNLTVVNGLYAVVLGSTSLGGMPAIPPSILTQTGLSLKVAVNGAPLLPNVAIIPALQADIAYSVAPGSVSDGGITSVSWGKITGTPSTLAGYGIGDAVRRGSSGPGTISAGIGTPSGGQTGDLYIATDTQQLYQLAAGGWMLISGGAPGPQGPAGPVGPAGPAGPAGADGAQGPAGPAGAVGAAGPAGAVGPPGSAGPQGANGPAGAVGAAGPVGPAGAQGPIGATGPAGPAGAAGAVGAAGSIGPAGAQGPIGATGPAGAVGAAGPIGPAGPQGPIGATGPAGPAGAQGPAGANGAAGAPGPQGVPGPAGLQGLQGPQGLQGATGAAGPQGPAGATGGIPVRTIANVTTTVPILAADAGGTVVALCGGLSSTSATVTIQLPAANTIAGGGVIRLAINKQSLSSPGCTFTLANGDALYLDDATSPYTTASASPPASSPYSVLPNDIAFYSNGSNAWYQIR